MYRIEFISADNVPMVRTIQINDNRTDVSKATLSDIKRRLKLGSRREVEVALADWTPDQLRAHLSRFTRAEFLQR